MADVDRSELLIAFQAVTGKENLEECQNILENHGWDLEKAVQTALAMQEEPRSSRNQEDDEGENFPSSSNSSPSSSSSSPSSPSSSSSSSPPNSSSVAQNRQAPRAPLLFGSQTGLLGLVGWLFGLCWEFGISLVSSLLGIRPDRRERRDGGDSVAAAARFLLNYEQKFGATHPPFYQGSYNQALREAHQSFRMLLVYIHCDEHQDTDAFCRTTLASPEFTRFLQENNILLWCGNVNEQEGFEVSNTISVASYPFLGLIGPHGNRLAVIFRQDEFLPVTDLIAKMNLVVQRQAAVLRNAREEQEGRDRERQLRREQEREYEESLRADQEKERRLAEEKEANERKIAEEKRIVEEKQKAEDDARLLREKKAAMLPDEPLATEADITTIIFRMMDGNRIQRRFRVDDAVQIMYDFIETKDIGGKPFTICTTHPKVSYTNKEQTLKEASLCPKALVIVEEI